MPTYVCYLPRDRFSPDQKRQIVDAITFRHSEATCAPSYFVQVVIEEARADRYLGANIRLITSGSAVIYVPVAPRNSGLA
jgi:phenylpyruvate tautomerase PptA (4-oxalocrotonate tautomerase family)